MPQLFIKIYNYEKVKFQEFRFYNHICLITSYSISQTISTVAGIGTSLYSGDGGLATNAQFSPHDVTIDKIGNIYITEYVNNTVRKIDKMSIISTVA